MLPAFFAMLLVPAAMPPDSPANIRPDEFVAAGRWSFAHLGGESAPLPFSFLYDGKRSGNLLPGWRVERATKDLDALRTQLQVQYTDPATGLIARVVAIMYRDFPTVEWTVYLENTGKADTPIISELQALDAVFPISDSHCLLHHNVGSPCKPIDYEPLVTELGPGTNKRITTSGGRPTNSDLPYFNMELGRDRGVIAVIGWPGQWAARFARDGALKSQISDLESSVPQTLSVTVGQELTHFRLQPGEKVRTPLVVLQFWQGGDWIRAQNVWRRWMLAHNVPQPDGRPIVPQMNACSSHQFGEMIHADEASQIFFVDRYLEERLPLDYWWMDAGWYPNKSGWPNTGTWEVDTKRFPRGLRAISDHAHARGVRTIVWFEPERVTAGTWLATEHPDWLLDGTLLNLGLPAARQWLTDHVDGLLKSESIDLYRQDFNMDPLDFWRKADAPDRQGITEIRHVEGYLAYWDELLRRHPGMLIDTCASGGRRNDLETLRRAVPLLRSDYILEPVGNQNHTYGISMWIPFYGTGVNQFEAYGFRSCMCPSLTACYDMRRPSKADPEAPARDVAAGLRAGRTGGMPTAVGEHEPAASTSPAASAPAFPPADYEVVRTLLAQWHRAAPNFSGDFYPLTPYSPADDVWMAWQFDRPEAGRGMIQAFRRPKSRDDSLRLKLRGLDPDARYRITDLDARTAPQDLTGRELMEGGLSVTLADAPSSLLLIYERAD